VGTRSGYIGPTYCYTAISESRYKCEATEIDMTVQKLDNIVAMIVSISKAED
jgi:hypothetical protein